MRLDRVCTPSPGNLLIEIGSKFVLKSDIGLDGNRSRHELLRVRSFS